MSSNNRVTVEDIYENKLLSSKINLFIDDNKTLEFITSFANEQGVNVSLGTVRNYKKKREESIQKGVPMENLLDRRKKTGNIVELKGKEDNPVEDATDTGGVYKPSSEKVITINQVLEELIDKGMKGVRELPVVDPNILLKAITEYNKVNTGNGGLTLQGVQELRLQVAAYEQSMKDIILTYIPEEEHEEVLNAMQDAEDKYYRELDLTSQGKKIREELKRLNIQWV